MKNRTLFTLLAGFLLFATAKAADPIPIIGFGILGDSNSDEYRANDNRGGSYANTTLNWMEQLVLSRSMNFGQWGTWGGPRRTGYEYNWARSGATARSVVSSGQHTGLASQVAAGKVSHVFMYYGINDFHPANGSYRKIYNGSLSNRQVLTKVENFIADVTTAVDTIVNAGNVQIVLVNLLDPDIDPQLVFEYPSASGRQRVSDAINAVNVGLQGLAISRGIVIADLDGLSRTYVGLIDKNGFVDVAGVNLQFTGRGNDPYHFHLSDTHYGTVGNGGSLANVVFLDAINSGYGLGIPLLTDQEIQENAGILPPPIPEISSFTSTPSQITDSGTATLTWQANSALRLSLDQNIGNVLTAGTITVNPSSTTTYTLTATGPGGTTTAQVDVIVGTGNNNSPQAQNDAFNTIGTLIVDAPGVLTNDSDSDADPLTATLITGASNGVVTLDTNGAFNYTPDAGFTGADTFVYSASDPSSASNQAIATITVSAADSDTNMPVPSPMSWAAVPTATGPSSIGMTATLATDVSGVEYRFTSTDGGNSSPWQDSPAYEDIGLQPNTTYTYIVSARDKSPNQNTTTASLAQAATTHPGNNAGVSTVSTLDEWVVDGNYTTQNAQFNVSAGSNRLVLVALSAENNQTGSSAVNSVELGGQALTEILDFSVGSTSGYNNLHWIGYLPESQIAARNGNQLTVSYTRTPSSPFDEPKFHYASYANVDQAAPIASFSSGLNTNTSSLQLNSALSAENGDRIIGFNVLGQHYVPGTSTTGYIQQTQSIGARNGHASAVFEHAVTTSITENPTFTSSTRTRMAVSGIVLNGLDTVDIVNIELDANFDSGSIGSYTITGSEINLSPRSDTIENSNDSYTYWVNFKLSNVAEREVTLNFQGIDAVPFLSYTGIEENQLVFSCDGTTWQRLTQHTYDPANNGTYTVVKEFACNDVQIATFFPYSYARMQNLANTAELSPWASRSTLGYSGQGLDITLLTITDSTVPDSGKEQIYLIGRQHAAETASSHMLEGLINFLISNDEEAQTIRENFVWHIVPMTNPDGVFQGNSITTSDSRDSNMDWGNFESQPINLVRSHFDSVDDAVGIDMFIDWHSQMNDTRWSSYINAQSGNTFFPILFSLTDFNEQETTSNNCTAASCSASDYATQQRGLFSVVFEPSPHLSSWSIDSLNQQGVNTTFVITEYFGVSLDTDPPEPNPMTWAAAPASSGASSIAMTATVASHANDVEYLFVNTDGSGHNSGWQSSNVYEDTGLQPGTPYSYNVIARDQINQNETSASGILSATTDNVAGISFVSVLDEWVVDGNYTTQDAAFSVSAGSDRLVLVALSTENNQNSSTVVSSVELGGQALTEIMNFSVGNTRRYNNLHWIGYLPESQIAARNTDQLTISYSTSPSSPFDAPKIHYASYANVDQATPISSFSSSLNTNTSSMQLNSALSAQDGDRIIGFNVLGQHYVPGISTAGYIQQTQSIGATNGHASGVFERAVTTSITENPTFTSSTRTRMAVSGFVLNAR